MLRKKTVKLNDICEKILGLCPSHKHTRSQLNDLLSCKQNAVQPQFMNVEEKKFKLMNVKILISV